MKLGIKPLIMALTMSLLFLAPASARSPLPDPLVTTDGIAGFTVGTPKAKIAKRLGKGNPNYDEPYLCDIHEIKGLKGISVMIQKGVATSVIIDNPKYRTASGARVGTHDVMLRRLYGKRLKRETHTYQDEPAAYYTLRSSSGNEVVFDVGENRKVDQIRAGKSAGYVEGCL